MGPFFLYSDDMIADIQDHNPHINITPILSLALTLSLYLCTLSPKVIACTDTVFNIFIAITDFFSTAAMPGFTTVTRRNLVNNSSLALSHDLY